MELYFAVPCLGAILHTVNIRLTDEHIAYIMNHAEDVVLFVDPDLLPTVERVAPSVRSLRHIIVMDDRPAPLGDCDYEELSRDRRSGLRVSRDRGEQPLRHVLHVRHDGRSQGVVYTQRGLYPAHARALPSRCPRHQRA